MNPIETVDTSTITQLKVGRNEFSKHEWDPRFSFDVITTIDEVVSKKMSQNQADIKQTAGYLGKINEARALFEKLFKI